MESTRIGTGEVTPQSGLFVQDVNRRRDWEEVSKTVNIAATANVKDAAGVTVVIDLPQGPVLDQSGAGIGSFWGALKNKQYEERVQAVTETDGSADFAIYDPLNNLENIFEGVSKARYIAKLTDGDGNVLTGFIGLIAVSSNVYTFDVYSDVDLGTQNWIEAGATDFALTNGVKAEIYRYSSSFKWGSTNTFTLEVPYHDPDDPRHAGMTEFRLLAGMANGNYAIDYKRGRVFAKKANADDTETVTYKAFGEHTMTPTLLTKSTTVVGGAVQLTTTSTIAKTAIIQAPFANTREIAIGLSGVDAATETTGILLAPGNSMTLENVDLSTLYMDVLVNNEDVTVLYFK